MSKILNDAIHGTIELDPLLIKIIDTPQFQRLRNIKQLGGCYFVYPSASHNRFEHSIGTCYLASKLAHQLQKRLAQDIKDSMKSKDTARETYAKKLGKAKMTKDDKLCIEIAGLCHDIGHGPYSHLFDRLFNKAMKEKEKDSEMKEWTHEEVSRRMIDYMLQENDDLKKAFQNKFGADTEWRKDFIKDLIDGNKKKEKDKAKYYMYEIVANKRNEIDVDKMDYFARDCHGLGMKSNFDHLRFISQCRVMFSSEDETTIAVRDKEEYNLYELFHTRIGLFRRAYYHKVTKAVELMFTDVLVKANDHLLFKNNKGEIIKMSTAWKHPDVYEKLTDNVFERILMEKNPNEDMKKAQELISNVYKRKLYRLVDETSPKEEIGGKNYDMEDLLLKKDLTKDDFAVQKVTYSYGKRLENPITSVYFFTKDHDTDCFPGTRSKMTSLFLPDTFQEETLRVYSKNDEKIDILKKETTVCLKQVDLYSVNDPAIKQEHRGSAEAGTGTKHKSSAEGTSGPSKRPK